MLIRRYDPARGDGPATFGVFVRAVRRTASAHYDAAQVAAWTEADPTAWAEARSRRRTFVAEVDGRVVGVVDLDDGGLIDVLFVDPDIGRRGVGSALLAEVLREGARRGIRELHARVSLTAEPVFARSGFRTVARHRPVVRGRAFVNLEMRRPTAGTA